MDLAKLTEWYTKIIAIRLPELTPEDAQSLAAEAAQRVLQYAQDHPYITVLTLVQVGLVPVLGADWMAVGLLKIVGFGPLGPYANSIAAWYQSTRLGGYIPANSIFAACQRLTMAKL